MLTVAEDAFAMLRRPLSGSSWQLHQQLCSMLRSITTAESRSCKKGHLLLLFKYHQSALRLQMDHTAVVYTSQHTLRSFRLWVNCSTQFGSVAYTAAAARFMATVASTASYNGH